MKSVISLLVVTSLVCFTGVNGMTDDEFRKERLNFPDICIKREGWNVAFSHTSNRCTLNCQYFRPEIENMTKDTARTYGRCKLDGDQGYGWCNGDAVCVQDMGDEEKRKKDEEEVRKAIEPLPDVCPPVKDSDRLQMMLPDRTCSYHCMSNKRTFAYMTDTYKRTTGLCTNAEGVGECDENGKCGPIKPKPEPEKPDLLGSILKTVGSILGGPGPKPSELEKPEPKPDIPEPKPDTPETEPDISEPQDYESEDCDCVY